MPPAFSTHNPTAHLQSSSESHGGGDATPLDELITIHNLSVDPESQQVSLSSKSAGTQKANEQKLLEETLATINDLSQSAQITALKEEGNAAFKANEFTKAIELYTIAAQAASTRPLFEPSVWIREELSIILCNRAAAYSSNKMWVEALCDAEVVIQLKRNWNKGHFRKAKALQGLGHIEEAKDAALLGLEFEPDNSDLQAAYEELKA
ncbi:hypothetical protein H4Q26_011667 [Puccinia striiformis f. sp. tritici PST-130]|nr:hypothetical protein H4Q26_011667 [Puccinia striiformis f. sp. tritici PST-130]